MVPFSSTLPVIFVHPVHLTLFCIVSVWSFTDLSVMFLMTLEAVAKCVSFTPTGTHRSLVYMPHVHMYILYVNLYISLIFVAASERNLCTLYCSYLRKNCSD